MTPIAHNDSPSGQRSLRRAPPYPPYSPDFLTRAGWRRSRGGAERGGKQQRRRALAVATARKPSGKAGARGARPQQARPHSPIGAHRAHGCRARRAGGLGGSAARCPARRRHASMAQPAKVAASRSCGRSGDIAVCASDVSDCFCLHLQTSRPVSEY